MDRTKVLSLGFTLCAILYSGMLLTSQDLLAATNCHSVGGEYRGKPSQGSCSDYNEVMNMGKIECIPNPWSPHSPRHACYCKHYNCLTCASDDECGGVGYMCKDGLCKVRPQDPSTDPPPSGRSCNYNGDCVGNMGPREICSHNVCSSPWTNIPCSIHPQDSGYGRCGNSMRCEPHSGEYVCELPGVTGHGSSDSGMDDNGDNDDTGNKDFYAEYQVAKDMHSATYDNYKDVKTESRSTYDETKQAARTAYDEQKGQAIDTYRESRATALEEYRQQKSDAVDTYQETKQEAYDAYVAVKEAGGDKKQAYTEYKAIRDAALDEYHTVKAAAQATYNTTKTQLKETYTQQRSAASAQYTQTCTQAWETYQATKGAAWNNYEEAKQAYEEAKAAYNAWKANQ